jgi:hypothetical protein
MPKDDYREYHQRVVARLRSAAEHSTTKAIKACLEAEEHEHIARGETEVRVQSPPINSPPGDKPQKERKRQRHRNGSLFVPS